MSQPIDPQTPAPHEPTIADPVLPDPVDDAALISTPAVTPTPPAAPQTPASPFGGEQAEGSDRGAGSKAKAAAVLAGAAALANKVRQEAPKKVQDIRQKRAVGRHVVLTERAGQPIAIGPYADDQAARQDSVRLTGAPRIVELVSPQAYFPPQDQVSGSDLPQP